MEMKNKWNKEYQTSFLDEVIFLKENGIRYTWVYTNTEGKSVWKFKKENAYGMHYLKCIPIQNMKFKMEVFHGIFK